MIEKQEIIPITPDTLQAEVKKFKEDGCRLVQICCTQIADTFEIDYSFDKNFVFTGLRIILDSRETVIPSISEVYWSSFIYENEIHDLYGIKFKGIAVDYKGNFYKTAIKNPFYNAPSKDEGKGATK